MPVRVVGGEREDYQFNKSESASSSMVDFNKRTVQSTSDKCFS